MGLVKTRPRLAEDMHRRGEASEGTLPKATRRARKHVRSPYQAVRKQQRAGGDGSVANVGVLPVPMLPISNWGLKTARRGRLAPPGGGGAMGASPATFV